MQKTFLAFPCLTSDLIKTRPAYWMALHLLRCASLRYAWPCARSFRLFFRYPRRVCNCCEHNMKRKRVRWTR